MQNHKPMFPSIRQLEDSFRKLSRSEGMEKIKSAFGKLTSGLLGVMPKKIIDDEAKKEIKKTQQGATHIVNPTFKSRRLMRQTPAEYRRFHMGNPHKAALRIMKGVKRDEKFKLSV